MTFDAHSLERLQQLGRTLPKPLPRPEPPATAAPKASEKRHRVETETNPEALFRELMRVSPDGTVPPHLMVRLREAEAEQRRHQQEKKQVIPSTAAKEPAPPSRKRELRANQQRRQPADSEERQLYTDFQAMLLEGDAEA
jgi:hypothetical protein